jgi:peptidoglycan hydrolase CwlO-like protein
MGKTTEERLAKLEATVADLVTNAQADGKDIKKLKKEVKALERECQRLENDVRLLRREI